MSLNPDLNVSFFTTSAAAEAPLPPTTGPSGGTMPSQAGPGFIFCILTLFLLTLPGLIAWKRAHSRLAIVISFNVAAAALPIAAMAIAERHRTIGHQQQPVDISTGVIVLVLLLAGFAMWISALTWSIVGRRA